MTNKRHTHLNLNGKADWTDFISYLSMCILTFIAVVFPGQLSHISKKKMKILKYLRGVDFIDYFSF